MLRFLGRLALALLLAFPSAALAHGVLRASDPRSGARLSVAPRSLRLTFNEAIELAVARLELLDPDGRGVALSALRRGDSAAVLVADVTGALRAGRYTVAWQIAGRDGHPVRGRYRFSIDSGATGLAPAAPAVDTAAHAEHVDVPDTASDTTTHAAHAVAPPDTSFDAQSPAYAAVRWLGLAAMLTLVGAVAFRTRVVPAAARRGAPDVWAAAATRDAGRLAVAASALLLVASLLRLAAQSVALQGAGAWRDPARLGALLGGTTWGTAWWLLVAATLVALVGLLLARRASSAGWMLASLGVVGVALAAALSGHAASVSGRAPFAVVVDAAHVLAAGGWLGTLLLVVAAGLPAALRLQPDARVAATTAAVNAFSPVALACAAVVALTGGLSAWLHLGALDALWRSAYGRTLLVKLALLVLVAAAGAYNWRRVRPALGDASGAARLRRSATVELALGALVLVVTAVLVATPTDVVP
ncbi:CopD family protein [Roseisolibacter agri]|uniref:Copper transport protein YcnJ n=1 Tax=Roseisolibacter agri TaxID=2014610 RepID=A0AA37VA89_9BACT|nr:CopD family protein [Roseisolibacter agri]GLC25198.1 hypothetical protein rosag_17110 [Roseisolibacter agri]